MRQPPHALHSINKDQAAIANSNRAARSQSQRRLWLTVHLYLGLFAGAVFAMTGLTGSLIAFGGDIDAWLNADLMTVAVPSDEPATRRPVDDLFAAARSMMPADSQPMYMSFTADEDRAVSVSYGVPSRVLPEEMDHYEVFVDPYSAKPIGQREQSMAGRPLSGPLMNLLVSLHYSMLLGETGTALVGIIAVLLIVSVVTGIVLWWPRNHKWAQALSIKRKASAERLNYDLHKTFGVYSALFLLVILFSGIYMNLPDYVRPMVELFSPAPGWPENVTSTVIEDPATLTPGQALAASETLFNDGELQGIEFPMSPDGTYLIRRRAPDEVTRAYAHRQVWVDPHSGAILAVNDPSRYTAGQKFLEWQFPLHSGEAFGLPGRIVVLLLGLIPPLLYITGIIRWLQKRRATARKTLPGAAPRVPPV